LAGLASGKVDVVCNAMVLTEGWDCPVVSCVVLARPTKSLGLFRQMAGRVLRPHEPSGKVDAIIGQIFNTTLELKAKGVNVNDINSFLYRDYGLDLYGTGVAASPAFLKEHPDAVKAFIRATIKGSLIVAILQGTVGGLGSVRCPDDRLEHNDLLSRCFCLSLLVSARRWTVPSVARPISVSAFY